MDAARPIVLAPHPAERDGKKPASLDILTQLGDGQARQPGLLPAPASASALPPSGSAPPHGGGGQDSLGESLDSVSQSDGDSSVQHGLEVSV